MTMEYSYYSPSPLPAKPHMYKAPPSARRPPLQSSQHHHFQQLQQEYHASQDLLYSLWPSVEPNYAPFFSPEFMAPAIATVSPEELATPPPPPPQQPQQPTRAYVCGICGNKYQRNTHLRRHEATRKLKKIEICFHCWRR